MKPVTTPLVITTAMLALTLSASAAVCENCIGPKIPKAIKGEQCVEETSIMRRNHMNYLMHQRDDTVHSGIRTTKYSLRECLGCHVDPAVEIRKPQEHFCGSCHTYVGVTIDCFQCHNPFPEKSAHPQPGNSQP